MHQESSKSLNMCVLSTKKEPANLRKSLKHFSTEFAEIFKKVYTTTMTIFLVEKRLLYRS